MEAEKLYYLKNHDNQNDNPIFEDYKLEDFNQVFGTNYASIDEAVFADPEYVFNEEQMLDYLTKIA